MGLGWFISLLSSNLVWLGGELSKRINSTKKGDISRAHISLALFVDIYILFKKQAGVYYPRGGGGGGLSCKSDRDARRLV